MSFVRICFSSKWMGGEVVQDQYKYGAVCSVDTLVDNTWKAVAALAILNEGGELQHVLLKPVYSWRGAHWSQDNGGYVWRRRSYPLYISILQHILVLTNCWNLIRLLNTRKRRIYWPGGDFMKGCNSATGYLLSKCKEGSAFSNQCCMWMQLQNQVQIWYFPFQTNFQGYPN